MLDGTKRASFIETAIGIGKTMSFFSLYKPLTMIFAARSALMMNGIGKVFTSVIGVFTKPGETVCTLTFVFTKSVRKDSRKLICAALLGP